MATLLKIPLVMRPQPEGGFTVTSPVLPELVTEGDTVEEALQHVHDALRAVIEIYEDTERALPLTVREECDSGPVWFESLMSVT